MSSDGVPSLEVPELRSTDRLVAVPSKVLRRAVDGGAPGLPTSVRVAHRAGALLVRFDGRDRGSVATLTRRGDPLWTEDVFEVFLGLAAEPAVYYEFEVNPLGAVFEARVDSPDGARATMRVDSGWTLRGFSARVRRGPLHWSAVFRIPLAGLGADSGSWRANFYRIDRGSPDEYSAWSPTLADPPDFHRPALFGRLRLVGPVAAPVGVT